LGVRRQDKSRADSRKHSARIFADFNGLRNPDRTEGRLAVSLDTFGTLRDLTNPGPRLAENLRLTVYDWSDDDLEAEATAWYYQDGGPWWAGRGLTIGCSGCGAGHVFGRRKVLRAGPAPLTLVSLGCTNRTIPVTRRITRVAIHEDWISTKGL
jgi:hypothetical protein